MADAFPLPLDGACRCGRISYRVTQPPLFTFACHCTDCQQLAASAFSLGMAVEAAGFELRGEPHVWQKTGSSGGWSRRHTCPDCAGWTHTTVETAPELVVVRPTTLADRAWVRPVAQIFTRSALPWATLATLLTYEAEFSDPGPLKLAFSAAGIRPGPASG